MCNVFRTPKVAEHRPAPALVSDQLICSPPPDRSVSGLGDFFDGLQRQARHINQSRLLLLCWIVAQEALAANPQNAVVVLVKTIGRRKWKPILTRQVEERASVETRW